MDKLLSMLVVQLCFKLSNIILFVLVEAEAVVFLLNLKPNAVVQ
jgi:hypothetical protein